MTNELSVTVSPAQIGVEPGGSAQVALQVQNRGTVVDEFVIEVLGDAASWISVDRSRVPTFPGATESAQISIKPPRASHPEAGTVPVGFRVTSSMDPGVSVVEECRVVLKPFTEIGAEVAPRTARGRFSAKHRLRVSNRGNAPVTVALRAEVQQGDCHVSISQPTMELVAGERRTSKVKVLPASTYLRGAEEYHQYKFSVEPKGGAPISLDATMRQRPIAQIPTAMLLAAALVLGGAYVAYGRGPNPLETALHARWSGPVDVIPSPSPTESQATQAPPPLASPPPQQVGPPPPPCTPGAPSNLVATAGNATATVTWSAPAASCRPQIASYTLYGSPGNLTAVLTNSGQPLTLTITNLINGTAYTFTATATNSNGTGPRSSPSNPVTPSTVPTSPLNVQAAGGDTIVTVTWSPPSSNGGSPITGYLVIAVPLLPGKSGQASVAGNATTATVTGLTNGTAYMIQVAAKNGDGYGATGFSASGAAPQCAAIHGATLTVSLTAISWSSVGDCAPFSGSINCQDQVVNSSGQPAGTGTENVTGITTTTGTSNLNAGFGDSFSWISCTFTIHDAKNNTATATGSAGAIR